MNANDIPVNVDTNYPSKSKLSISTSAALALSIPILLAGLFYWYLETVKLKYIAPAITATNIFHERLSSGYLDVIIQDADPSFRHALTESRTRRFLEGVRQKIGTCRYGKPLSQHVHVDHNGTFVILTLAGNCSSGRVLETFTWRVGWNHEIALFAYNINSDTFLDR